MTIVLIILLPFLTAALTLLFTPQQESIMHRWLASVPAIIFIYLLSRLPALNQMGPLEYHAEWIPAIGVSLSLRLDGLSLLFGLLISGIGCLVVLYSGHYLGKQEDRRLFFLYIFAFMGSMLGVVLASDLILLYLFWELTSVTSFLLIGYWSEREESQAGAQKALIFTFIGGLAMLAGFALLYLMGGTMNLVDLQAQAGMLKSDPRYGIATALILAGAFTKSAQFPFHVWLPGAMAAPTPVSAYLHSATLVKGGIYLLARLTPVLGDTSFWLVSVSGIGLITMIVGAWLALQQSDLKALLAFSTVSQLGFILMALGTGTASGVQAATYHILAHASFKGSLFLLVGVISHEAGSRDLQQLPALWKSMPITGVMVGLAALSMAGIPFLNGFVSKELIFEALLHLPQGLPGVMFWLLPLGAVFGSILTAAYSLVLVHQVFFTAGDQTDETSGHAIHEAPLGLLLSPGILVGVVVFTGLWPDLAGTALINPAAGASLGGSVDTHYQLWHGLNQPLLMSLIALTGGTLIYWARRSIIPIMIRTRPPLHVNAIYRATLRGIDTLSTSVTHAYISGKLRHYVGATLAAAVVFTGTGVLLGSIGSQPGGWPLQPVTWGAVSAFEAAAAIGIILATLYAVRARRYLAAAVATGFTGSLVSLFYALFRAPDLALTQIIVESVSTVLIVLALLHLPQIRHTTKTIAGNSWRSGLSIITGLFATGLVLWGQLFRFNAPISHYFVENSAEQAHGHNIVNVILVDFRGLDTMGEVTVLAISAIAVYTLIRLKLKPTPESEEQEEQEEIVATDIDETGTASMEPSS